MLRPGHKKTPPRRAGAGHTGDAALCAPRQRRHAGGAGGASRARGAGGAGGAGGANADAGRAGRKAPPRRAARHNAKWESLRGAGRPRQKRSGCPARDGVGLGCPARGGAGQTGMPPCVRRASGDTRGTRGRGRRESGAGRGRRGVRAARAGRAGRKAPPRWAARHNAKRESESLRGAGRPRQKRSGCPARDGVGLGRLGGRRGGTDGNAALCAPRQRRHAGHAGTRAARGHKSGAGRVRRGGAGSARGTRGTQSAAPAGGASQCKTGKPPRGGAPQAKAERLPGAGRGRGRWGCAAPAATRGRRVTMQSGKASAGRGAPGKSGAVARRGTGSG